MRLKLSLIHPFNIMLTTKSRKRTETKRNSLLVSCGGNRLMSHGVRLAESVELQ